ncbi:hypothetical protein SAMN05421786_103468 [Chryseobacterium ureilyticum]|uniref:Glycosyltransferase Family 4 n=1 Tax=Chryseobacterium ureilyticum TaxID=373668 RepID=A0A1N7NEU4_9FLAO|nr:hypothetical protein SAMN05421786_103468 [Chryseobacterium ureilyticum]
MQRILFIHHCLRLGGGEKYIKEICDFSLQHNIHPTIMIPNNLEEEYYDIYFKSKKIDVIRFKIFSKKDILRNLFSKDFYWNIYIRFLLNKNFDRIHFINLGVASAYHNLFRHKKKVFWHVGNAIQYPDYQLPFDKAIFSNVNNELICINPYQIEEIVKQYKNINCKVSLFKLFLNNDNT